MRAYLLGLIVGPFVVLGAVYALNERGTEQCETRRDVTFNGHLVAVRYCVGSLGLTTNEPQIIARLD